MNPLDILTPFLIACLVFVPVERVLAFRPEQKIFRRGWGVDLTHVMVTGFLIKAGTIVLFALSAAFLEKQIPAHLRAAVAAQPFWLAFLEVLLIADLGFYWVHRAFHAIPLLWKFHSVHHSIEEMDFLAAHRVHPLDQILTRSATLLPVFALGFSPQVILLWTAVYHAQSLLLHSNIKLGFGPLRRIIALPVFHHWHHARHPEAVDRNFSGQLSLLDLLFGTLHLPPGKVPEKYGIDAPVPGSYLGQLAHPFRYRQ
ncbi:MAG: sterol desaturase family protein [Alphaproteobacteria bacterium]|nr:sterol desaturase family protein [Alphaproteobacteria bacterium]